MTYEERLKQLHVALLEFATTPTADVAEVIAGLTWLRHELDLQIVALRAEASDARTDEPPPENPGKP